jgi:hypothetical protein
MGSLIAELKAAGIASGRVRGGEPAPGDVRQGTQDDPFQRFVVLVELGNLRIPRVPVQATRYGIRAYARTHQDARALYGEISDALHLAGGRVSATNVPLYNSLDTEGGQQTDPRTKHPYYESTLEVIAGTQTFV